MTVCSPARSRRHVASVLAPLLLTLASCASDPGAAAPAASATSALGGHRRPADDSSSHSAARGHGLGAAGPPAGHAARRPDGGRSGASRARTHRGDGSEGDGHPRRG